MILTRSIEFPMGHRLKDHPGLCKHVHGHNYKVVARVMRSDAELNEMGMVMDFSHLKEAMELTFSPYDHALVIEEKDPFIELKNNGPGASLDRVIVITMPPTAEILANVWAEQLQEALLEGIKLVELEVYESSTTSAIWMDTV